jgi:hypothetical protein
MTAGRPKKWKSEEELQTAIDNYFLTTPEEKWTMTGLCICCDMDYQTLINYSKQEEFFEPIKRAKIKVHNQYELDLREKGGSGPIFALKNFGWKDKQEIDNKVTVERTPIDELVQSIEDIKNK